VLDAGRTARSFLVSLVAFSLAACGTRDVPAGMLPSERVDASHPRDCFASPGSCGYPDPSDGTAGVPRATKLTPRGSIAVTKRGTVLQNLDVTGTITIQAANTTIRNVRLTVVGRGSGTAGIWIEPGAGPTTISDTTIRGTSAHQSPESAIFNHNGESLTLTRVYFYNFADPVEGAVTIDDSYIDANGSYGSGSAIAHIEDVYASDARVVVKHSVLLNPTGQTATVFMDTNGGQGAIPGDDKLTVVNSLLAGGGWTLYPSAKSTSPGTGRMNVSGNRFARCLSTPVYDKRSGGTSCKKGPDSHGYYPYGGYYGVAADLYCPPKRNQRWSANVWDDDDTPIRCP
jgi:hypothetical protein